MTVESGFKSVLVSEEEVMAHRRASPAGLIPREPFLEIVQDAQQHEQPDGIVEAALLLLKYAPTEIQFVDITSKELLPGKRPEVFARERLLGLNDHDGGEDGGYKVLVHRFGMYNIAPYVLMSPPDESGRPSNIAFHHADYQSLFNEPRGSAAHDPHLGQGDGRTHFLFGGPQTPSHVTRLLKSAGFTFHDTPYSHARLDALTALANEASHNKAEKWPGAQFAKQVAIIESQR